MTHFDGRPDRAKDNDSAPDRSQDEPDRRSLERQSRTRGSTGVSSFPEGAAKIRPPEENRMDKEEREAERQAAREAFRKKEQQKQISGSCSV